MKKQCLICEEEEAQYAIKDSKDYYCKDCATEQFGDISYLVPIEEKNAKKTAIEKLEENQEVLK